VSSLREFLSHPGGETYPEYWAAVERHCQRLGVPLSTFERGESAGGCRYLRPEEPDVHFELEARPDLGLVRVALDVERPDLYQAMRPVLEAGRLRLMGMLGTGAQFRDGAGPGTVSEWLPFDPQDPECARATALRLASYVGALNPILERVLGEPAGK
jgi:hypothetical protein